MIKVYIAYCLDCEAVSASRVQRIAEQNALQHSAAALKKSIKPHRVAFLEYEIEPTANGQAHVVSNG